jgi:3'(2'), 5'-bisphosphate nucleotidase
MPANFDRELRVAVEAVAQAAGLCQAVQAEITPAALEKKDKSPVTVADFGSQALVCRALAAAFPGDPIVAEEDSAELRQPENALLAARVAEHVRRHQAGTEADVLSWIDLGRAADYTPRFWTLDPIDGTKGFLRAEQYAVALALIVDGQVAAAALACPNLPLSAEAAKGAMFAAARGAGAVWAPLPGGTAQAVRVSPTSEPARARFCESVESGHSRQDTASQIAVRLGITAPPLRLDSQAKYAVVAAGGAEIYLRLPTRADYREKIWDHAAGALVIAEAGGRVTDVAGRPLEFTHGSELAANRGVVATNGPLHGAVLEAVAALGVQ